jgi:hypothetical protein
MNDLNKDDNDFVCRNLKQVKSGNKKAALSGRWSGLKYVM